VCYDGKKKSYSNNYFSCVKFIVDTLPVDRDSEARATKNENKEAYAESERIKYI